MYNEVNKGREKEIRQRISRIREIKKNKIYRTGGTDHQKINLNSNKK